VRAWAQKNRVSGIVLNKALHHQSRGPAQISARGVIERYFPPWRKATTLVSFQSRKRPLNTSDTARVWLPLRVENSERKR
jgi:hypothetical protein